MEYQIYFMKLFCISYKQLNTQLAWYAYIHIYNEVIWKVAVVIAQLWRQSSQFRKSEGLTLQSWPLIIFFIIIYFY